MKTESRIDAVRHMTAGAAVAGIIMFAGACGASDDTYTIPDSAEVYETPQSGVVYDIEVPAGTRRFEPDTLEVATRNSVIISLRNETAERHSITISGGEGGSGPLASVEPFEGIGERDVEFEAPAEPGTYAFFCDVHPEEMTGELIVVAPE